MPISAICGQLAHHRMILSLADGAGRPVGKSSRPAMAAATPATMTAYGSDSSGLIRGDPRYPCRVADYMAHCLFESPNRVTTPAPRGPSACQATSPRHPRSAQMFGGLGRDLALQRGGRSLAGPETVGSGRVSGPGRGTTDERCRPHLCTSSIRVSCGRRGSSWSRPVPRLREIQRGDVWPTACAPSPGTIQWHAARRGAAFHRGGQRAFPTPCPQTQYVANRSGLARQPHLGRARRGGKPLFCGRRRDTRTRQLLPAGADQRAPRARSSSSHRRAQRAHVRDRGGGGAARIGGGAAWRRGASSSITAMEGPALGDTLQALRRHAPDVCPGPHRRRGRPDFAHVDFAALAAGCPAGKSHDAVHGSGRIPAGHGLRWSGRERSARSADAATRQRLQGEVDRLARPEADGPPVQGADGFIPPAWCCPPAGQALAD